MIFANFIKLVPATSSVCFVEFENGVLEQYAEGVVSTVEQQSKT